MSKIVTSQAKAKELLIKAKIYRFMALIFALFGLVMFGVGYFRITDGDITVLLHDPFLIIVIIFPFLPAALLSWLVRRTEKKVIAILANQG